jgi:hypothetical protein
MNHTPHMRCDDSTGADSACATHVLRTIGMRIAEMREVYEHHLDLHSLSRRSLQHDR